MAFKGSTFAIDEEPKTSPKTSIGISKFQGRTFNIDEKPGVSSYSSTNAKNEIEISQQQSEQAKKTQENIFLRAGAFIQEKVFPKITEPIKKIGKSYLGYLTGEPIPGASEKVQEYEKKQAIVIPTFLPPPNTKQAVEEGRHADWMINGITLGYYRPKELVWDEKAQKAKKIYEVQSGYDEKGNTITQKFEIDATPQDIKDQASRIVGSVITYYFANQLLGGLISKVPFMKPLYTKGLLQPWKIGYPLAITTSGLTGAAIGGISYAQDYKQRLKNIATTAGWYMIFAGIAYPIQQLFRPVITKEGKVTVYPKKGTPAFINEMTKKTVAGNPLYFRSPNNPDLYMKVTPYEVTTGNAESLAIKPYQIKTIQDFSKVDIEIFRENPSLFNQVVNFISGKEGPVIKIPLETPEINLLGVPGEVAPVAGAGPTPIPPVEPVIPKPPIVPVKPSAGLDLLSQVKFSAGEGLTKIQKGVFVNELLKARNEIIKDQTDGNISIPYITDTEGKYLDWVGKEDIPITITKGLDKNYEKFEKLGLIEKVNGKYKLTEAGNLESWAKNLALGPQYGVKESIHIKIPGDGEFRIIKNVSTIDTFLKKLGVKSSVGEVKPISKEIQPSIETPVVKGVKLEVKPISKELEPLVREARKYDNFADFEYAMLKDKRPSMRPEPSDEVILKANQIRRVTRDAKRLSAKDFGGQKDITVFRTGNSSIKLGDYVYAAKEEAEHALRAGQGKRIYSKNIKANDLIEAGLPSGEFFYSPSKLGFNSLEDFYAQATKGIEKVAPKGFTWKERGFITSVKEELPQLKVAGQYVPRSTDRLAMKAKTLIKEDITTAEKVARSGLSDEAMATGTELVKYYSNESIKATDQAIKDVLNDKAAKLANDLARKYTEAGRIVEGASILSRLTPEGQLRFAAREIQKYNETVKVGKGGLFGLKKKIPELTKDQTDNILKEMNAIKEMAEGEEKAMRFQKLQDYIRTLVPTPLFKKIIAVWKSGLLTGIKTSGLNIFANISHAGTEIVKNISATMVDKITSFITGKRTVTFNLQGIPSGVREGLKKGRRYLTTGFDERNIGAKLDYKKVNFGKGKLAQGLQAYSDTIFRIMGAEDQPFYYAAKVRSLYEQSKVATINKGLKGEEAQKLINALIQNPTDEMIRYASIDAETAVFQNKTLLGQAARGIQKTGVGEIIVPFGRTPSSVAMQIVNYSPAGIVKTIAENIGKGRFDQRLFAQGMGRGITGMAAMGLGAYLFSKGLMTLARPAGEKEQKLWELEGRQANSIKIGGKWRQVQVFGPVGNVLLIGGYMQQEFSKSGSPTQAFANTLAGASKSFSQQTFLTGVSNFIDAISDPARSAESVAGSTLASSIPTIVSDIARATDIRERRANEIFDKFLARIPGVRETLEPQITVLGEEKETVGNPLEIMANPTRPSPAQSTPVVQELRRLWDVGYKVSPTLLGDKNGYSSLNPQQNTQLWQKAGQITNDKLNALFRSQQYQSLPDDEKGKVINDFVNKSKISARVAIVLELTQGLEGDALKAKLSELKNSGLMTREVFNKWQEIR